MDSKPRVNRGFVAGVAAFVSGCILSYFVLNPGRAFGHTRLETRVVDAVTGYIASHLVYVPSEGLFPIAADAVVPFPLVAVAYSLPVALLVSSGYYVSRGVEAESAVENSLHGSLASTGYLAVFVVSLFALPGDSPIVSTFTPLEGVVYLVLPVAGYAVAFGAAGDYVEHLTRGSGPVSEGWGYEDVRSLALTVLLLGVVLSAGIALAPTDSRSTAGPTTDVEFEVDDGMQTVSVSVEEMGNADYVLLDGDHTLEYDPVLNDTGESITLEPPHLEENGSLTVVSVVGDVDIEEEEGYRVALDVGDMALKTALESESWDFAGPS